MTQLYRRLASALALALIIAMAILTAGCGYITSGSAREQPEWLPEVSRAVSPSPSPSDTPPSSSPETVSPSPSADKDTDTAEPSVPAIAVETEPEPEPEPEPVDITVMIGGDVLIWGGVQRGLDAGGPDNVITPELRELFIEADLALINLEMPFSTRGSPMEGKEYTFRGNPEHVSLLTLFGVDVVSLANNHTLDYGRTAMLDTLTVLSDAGIGYSGAGENYAEASAPWVTEIEGRTIAILCPSRIWPTISWSAGPDTPGLFSGYDQEAVERAVSAAKELYDFVLVYVHWGIEYNTKPEQYQKDMAYGYIDAGADAVIGSHQHVLQGFEYYNGKPIMYSLGNFIFTTMPPETCAVRMHLTDDDIWFEVVPCTLKSPTTSLVTDPEEIETRLRSLEKISFGVTIAEDGRVMPS